MIGSRRRSRSTTNVWPGYVDALSALLMLVIFMLLVYVVSQLYLSQTLSDRDTQLARLNAQLNELSELLGLEENRSEALENQLTSLQERNNSLVGQLESTREQLMRQTAMADAQSERLASMEESIDEKDDISASQQAMILRLSNQIASLREQLRQIASALELQEQMTADKEQELEQVSRRLNASTNSNSISPSSLPGCGIFWPATKMSGSSATVSCCLPNCCSLPPRRNWARKAGRSSTS